MKHFSLSLSEMSPKLAVRGYLAEWRNWKNDTHASVCQLFQCLRYCKRDDVIYEICNHLRGDVGQYRTNSNYCPTELRHEWDTAVVSTVNGTGVAKPSGAHGTVRGPKPMGSLGLRARCALGASGHCPPCPPACYAPDLMSVFSGF